MSLSPDQVAIRRLGITATDISAILGVNPYRTPLDVVLEKRGERPPYKETERSRWGHILEPVIRTDYEERHGVSVHVSGTLHRPADEWMMATPDGLVYLKSGDQLADRGLEIKVHGRDAVRFGYAQYGDPGTDDVPLWELCQCAWGMAVTGLRRWDLVPFIDGAPNDYIIDRDDDLIDDMIERARKFMSDYLEGGNALPEPDGSKSWDRYLRKWKTHDAVFVNVAENLQALADIARLKDLRGQEAVIEKQLDTIVQRLKLIIGDHAGLEFPADRSNAPAQRITWKRNKPGKDIDWLGVLADMRQSAALVASGKTLELDAIEAALRKLGGGYVSETTFSGIKLAETVTLLRQTLTDIARAATESQRTVITIGNRPFTVPRHWK